MHTPHTALYAETKLRKDADQYVMSNEAVDEN